MQTIEKFLELLVDFKRCSDPDRDAWIHQLFVLDAIHRKQFH